MTIFDLQDVAKVFASVDWIVPPYIQIGILRQLASKIHTAAPTDKFKVLDLKLPQLYNESDLAVMLLERYRKTPHVVDFKTEIAEAIEASQIGLLHAAVATLLSVLEGIIRKIADSRGQAIGSGTSKLLDEVEELIAKEKSLAPHFHERVIMLEAFRDFLKNRLLIKTDMYNGVGNLNRHGVLHGVFSKYGHDFNFYRLISFLDLLCFIIAVHKGGISILAPDVTEDSEQLADYYRRIKGLSHIAAIVGARL